MKDIRSLFLAAKSSGKDRDVSAYHEAVQEVLKDSPNDYILQLEYIISSDIGLSTFPQFMEKYGLPIACYDDVMACFEKCIKKCNNTGRDDSEYKEMVVQLESYRKRFINCFAMFEYYQDTLPANYVETYYGFNENGHQNRKLAAGMIEKFHEAAIPDAIITAVQMGDKQYNESPLCTLLKHLSEKAEDPIYFEWVFEAAKDHVHGVYSNESLPLIAKKSATAIVESMRARNHQVFREATIMGNDDAMFEYSEDELKAIQDLISFKEYNLTWMDEITPSLITEAQKEIYSLYEELDGLILEEEDTVGEEKKDVDFVPIFGVIKSYSDSTKRSDGTDKSQSELGSIKFKHQLKFLTRGDNYSHACVSFNPELTEMYSFDDEGFVADNIMTNESWLSTDSIYICVMFVTKTEKERMLKFVKNLAEHKSETKYAYSNLLKAYISKPIKSDKRFVCSTFTSYILQCSNPKNLHRDYSRMRPEDITILPRAFYVMNAKDRLDFNKRKDEFEKRVKEIFSEYREEIEDYNNYLPKIMLKDRMDSLKTLDKILDWLIEKL